MDFGEILDKWEKTDPDKSPDMESMLDRYPPSPEGKDESQHRDHSGEKRRRLKSLRPQATLDLHGVLAAEANDALDRFLKESRTQGLKKVLVVHGKGHHSPNGPVLKKKVHVYLEKSVIAGEFGPADRSDGGQGATWVVLR